MKTNKIGKDILSQKRKTLGCGCILVAESISKGTVWVMKTPCQEHTPNWKKKGDRMVRLTNKKSGRGFTKSPKNKK